MPVLRRASMVGLLACLALAAAPAWTQSSAPPTGPYSIAGSVVNAATGAPLTGATVAILTAADSHTVASVPSGAEGRFAFDHLPAGKYQLTASRRGFRTAFYDEHGDYNSAIVTGPGQDTTHLVFRLPPGAVLQGVVTADGGDPVAGARVLLFEKGGPDAPDGSIHPSDAAITDDTGSYEFAGLAAGTYLVAVQAVPWYAMHPARPQDAAAPLDVAYPITYFDSTTDQGSATPIVLASGQRGEADVHLHAVPALHLTLALPADPQRTAHQLEPLVFGKLLVGDDAPLEAAVQGDHTLLRGIAPGRYELTQGNPPRVADLDLTASQPIDPGAGAPAVPVTVTLHATPGAELPASMLLRLEPLDGAGTHEQGAVATGGSARFPAVAPGAWRIHAEGGGAELPVVAVTVNDRAQAGSGFTVNDQPVALQVTVNPGKLRVEGFARKDGKGCAGVMVVLVPNDPAQIPELLRRDQSDSDGSFALLNVAPGSYILVAIQDGWPLDWKRPEVLARYLSGGVSVRITDPPDHLLHLDQPVPVQPR